MDGYKLARRRACLLGAERPRAAKPRNNKCKGSVVGKSGLVTLSNEACMTEELLKAAGGRNKTKGSVGLVKNFKFHLESNYLEVTDEFRKEKYG